MPLILVFDEYPYLRENVKGLDSIIQSIVDKYKDTSHMKFIICGSYVYTMKEFLTKQNPLFGRIPYYNRLIDTKKSVKENIRTYLTNPMFQVDLHL